MATFSLVHGAWHGGWVWQPLTDELERRGHAVHAPDLPCDDAAATAEDYARAVPAADVVVGHSLAGLTIPFVEARVHVFLSALVGGSWRDAFAPGFGDARLRDELGRSYYVDTAAAAHEFQYPPGFEHLLARLRRQADLVHDVLVRPERPVYVVCTRDVVIRPEWQRQAARERLGVEPVELESGHSPMLECPTALADLLERIAAA